MGQREMLKTSWVYSLKKEELVTYLVQCGQDSTGTVDEMRKRLAKFIASEQKEDMVKRLLEWQAHHEQASSGPLSDTIRVPSEKTDIPTSPLGVLPEISPRNAPPTDSGKASAPPTREDRIATVELIRKWGLKYDGGKDVLRFADRLEELADIYEVDLSAVVPVMCELLRDRALTWFRNNRKSWEHWSQFKKDLLEFFLPQRYFERLEAEIHSRTQRPRENFKEYVLALQELMYHSKLSEEEKLEVIFHNSLPDYQWYIRRRDFKTLDDLFSLAAELESIPSAKPAVRNEHHRLLQDQSAVNSHGLNNPQTYLCWEDEKIRATILIHHQVCNAIIDTGATRSFVTPAFTKKLRQKPEYITTDVEVALADGSKRRISTAVQTLVTFGDRTKTHEFLIMKEATEAIILGLDFLQAFETTIQCAGLTTSGRLANSQMPREDKSRTQVREHTILKFPYSCYQIGKSEKETIEERVKKFLETELPKFQQIQGLSTAATHKIVMKDDRPIKIRYAQRNPAMQTIIDEEVNSLLAKGCIEPSRSPYSFPITLVKKKNGSWRTCMDFRQLNARSVPDAYPLPRIDAILNRLRNAKYISSLDLKDGYWQIPMDEDSKKYTAFAVTGRGLYQWRVMPFGLHSAPATFQRALDSVIGPEMEPHAFAYLDDIIVIGRTFEEHLNNVKEMFRRLRAARLKINPEKCEFFKSETRYLGHIVTAEGIRTDPEKIAAIIQLPTPQDTKGIRRFLGITSWYRRFVPNFAKVSQPLTQLLKKGKHWKWGQEQQEAFETLKTCLTQAPVLACPDFTKPFILQTDASEVGLGAVLTQEIDEAEHVIAYASRHLNAAEKNYSATEKECLAIIWGIRKMRPYLEGYEFKVVTDHLSLKWLNSIDNPTGRLARWALELQQYKFSISYRRGKQNIVADALSRHPIAEIKLAQAHPLSSCTWYDDKIEAVRKNPESYADYAIVDNQLYRHFTREVNDEDSTPWKLCVPKHQRQQVLKETHDEITGGHMGIRKTLNKVANRYYWPGLARDVSKYVRQCGICQRYKISQQQPPGKMLTRIQEEPWSLLCADFIGPLPRTSHGNTMLLVLFDNFSKWVELIPCRRATAEGVVKAIRERIISRYGVPKVLITDNGTQFASRILKRYLEEMGVKQQFTAPYTPQENPTERANRTIKTIIAQFSREQHNKWDEFLPEVMLAINTSISESTGYSPAYLTQGRNPRLPKALYDEMTIGSGARCLNPEERANELKEIFRIVRHNLEKASQKQRHHYNLRRNNWTPKIGDHVLIRQHPLSKAVDNYTAKLAPKFKGPYIVTEFVSPVIIQVKALDDHEKHTAHISAVKPFHSNTSVFSLIHSRPSKSKIGPSGENMETEQMKFERTREKFRQNMRKTTENKRRTIFLPDDELPSSSKQTPPKQQSKSRQQRSTHSKPRVNRNKNKARNFRMTVVTPPSTVTTPATEKRFHLGSPKNPPPSNETIYISDEEAPAPPRWQEEAFHQSASQTADTEETTGKGPAVSQTPSPLLWDEDGMLLSDLEINPEDLNDPLVLEFYRSFWGTTDTTVDRRPPTPPSPVSSFSSLDWENENFRPPTPSRRQGYVNFEVQDRSYTHLGLQCYERVWRAQVLVPKTSGTAMITSQGASSTPPRPDNLETEAPPTPDRGWLTENVHDQQHETTPPPRESGSKTPTPSTPLLATTAAQPSTATLSDHPPLELLPDTVQQDILERSRTNKGKQMKFSREIWGHNYRIIITRKGEVKISRTSAKKGE